MAFDPRLIDDLARRLAGSVPESVMALRRDLEQNFKGVLQSQLAQLDLVTRDDFDGVEAGATHTLTDQGDGDISNAHFAAGRTFRRGYVTIGGEWVDQQAVFQDARGDSTDTEYLRADGSIGTTGSPFTPQGLFSVPGTNVLGLPQGQYTRVTGTGPPATAEDFRPFVSPDDLFNFAPDNYLQTPSERRYLWLLGGVDLTERVSLFVEGLFHQRESSQRLAPSVFRSAQSGAILANGRRGVPRDNYYNAFGVDLPAVARRFEEQGSRSFAQDVDTEKKGNGAPPPSPIAESSATAVCGGMFSAMCLTANRPTLVPRERSRKCAPGMIV